MSRKTASTPATDDLTETLERVAIADLRPHPRNDGTHPPEELRHLRQSIREHGIYRNIVIAAEGTLLAGHGVVEAAAQEGYTHVPAERKPYGPDDPRALKILVGDNHIARLRAQDDAVLTALLYDLAQADPLALLGTGFDAEALAALADAQGLALGGEAHAGRDVEPQIDRAEELRQEWGVELGQLWALGTHRLICGDCTDKSVVERLMSDAKAALCHADPPYGMGKEAEGIANDNLYASKLDAFQMQWWRTCRPFLHDNASAYIWGTAEDLWRLWYVGGLRDSERLTFRNELVWNKGDAGVGGISHQGAEGLRLYPGASERCLFFMLGEQDFTSGTNNAEDYWAPWEPIRTYLKEQRDTLGWDNAYCKVLAGHSATSGCHWFDRSQFLMPTQDVYESWQRAAGSKAFLRDYEELRQEVASLKDVYFASAEYKAIQDRRQAFYATRAYFDNTHDTMTDVWDFSRVQGEDRHDHPTPKPVALIERMITSSTSLGAVVYEPFLGSGTTLIACENLRRVCYGCELDPGYVAVTLQRWHDLTGQHPQRVT